MLSVVSQVKVYAPMVHTCQLTIVVDVKFTVPLWLTCHVSIPDVVQKLFGKTHVLSVIIVSISNYLYPFLIVEKKEKEIVLILYFETLG